MHICIAPEFRWLFVADPVAKCFAFPPVPMRHQINAGTFLHGVGSGL